MKWENEKERNLYLNIKIFYEMQTNNSILYLNLVLSSESVNYFSSPRNSLKISEKEIYYFYQKSFITEQNIKHLEN